MSTYVAFSLLLVLFLVNGGAALHETNSGDSASTVPWTSNESTLELVISYSLAGIPYPSDRTSALHRIADLKVHISRAKKTSAGLKKRIERIHRITDETVNCFNAMSECEMVLRNTALQGKMDPRKKKADEDFQIARTAFYAIMPHYKSIEQKLKYFEDRLISVKQKVESSRDEEWANTAFFSSIISQSEATTLRSEAEFLGHNMSHLSVSLRSVEMNSTSAWTGAQRLLADLSALARSVQVRRCEEDANKSEEAARAAAVQATEAKMAANDAEAETIAALHFARKVPNADGAQSIALRARRRAAAAVETAHGKASEAVEAAATATAHAAKARRFAKRNATAQEVRAEAADAKRAARKATESAALVVQSALLARSAAEESRVAIEAAMETAELEKQRAPKVRDGGLGAVWGAWEMLLLTMMVIMAMC